MADTSAESGVANSASAETAAGSDLPAGARSADTGDSGRNRPAAAAAALRPGCSTWQRTSLMIAARHGQLDVITRALEISCSQPQLDVVDEQGNTAVMIAAKGGHEAVVSALIGAGAELSIKNVEGKTALDLASTDSIRKEIKKAEARIELLLQSVLAGRSPPGLGASSSGSAAGGLPAGLSVSSACLARGECPF